MPEQLAATASTLGELASPAQARHMCAPNSALHPPVSSLTCEGHTSLSNTSTGMPAAWTGSSNRQTPCVVHPFSPDWVRTAKRSLPWCCQLSEGMALILLSLAKRGR